MPPPLPPDHDDDDGRAARHAADRARHRRGRRRPAGARPGRGGRAAGLAAADALHHARALHLYGRRAAGARRPPRTGRVRPPARTARQRRVGRLDYVVRNSEVVSPLHTACTRRHITIFVSRCSSSQSSMESVLLLTPTREDYDDSLRLPRVPVPGVRPQVGSLPRLRPRYPLRLEDGRANKAPTVAAGGAWPARLAARRPEHARDVLIAARPSVTTPPFVC